MPMFARTTTYYNHIFVFLRERLGMPLKAEEELTWLQEHNVGLVIAVNAIYITMVKCEPLPDGFQHVSKALPERLKERIQDMFHPSVLLRHLAVHASFSLISIPAFILIAWALDLIGLKAKVSRLLHTDYIQKRNLELADVKFSLHQKGKMLLVESPPVEELEFVVSFMFSFIKQTQLLCILSIISPLPIPIFSQNALLSKLRKFIKYFNPFMTVFCSVNGESHWTLFPQRSHKFRNSPLVYTVGEYRYLADFYFCPLVSCQEPDVSMLEFVDLADEDEINIIAFKNQLTAQQTMENALLENKDGTQSKIQYLSWANATLGLLNDDKVFPIIPDELFKAYFQLDTLPENHKFCKKLSLLFAVDKFPNVDDQLNKLLNDHFAFLLAFCKRESRVGQTDMDESKYKRMEKIAQVLGNESVAKAKRSGS
jgi:hypothetical protein